MSIHPGVLARLQSTRTAADRIAHELQFGKSLNDILPGFAPPPRAVTSYPVLGILKAGAYRWGEQMSPSPIPGGGKFVPGPEQTGYQPPPIQRINPAGEYDPYGRREDRDPSFRSYASMRKPEEDPVPGLHVPEQQYMWQAQERGAPSPQQARMESQQATKLHSTNPKGVANTELWAGAPLDMPSAGQIPVEAHQKQWYANYRFAGPTPPHAAMEAKQPPRRLFPDQFAMPSGERGSIVHPQETEWQPPAQHTPQPQHTSFAPSAMSVHPAAPKPPGGIATIGASSESPKTTKLASLRNSGDWLSDLLRTE